MERYSDDWQSTIWALSVILFLRLILNKCMLEWRPTFAQCGWMYQPGQNKHAGQTNLSLSPLEQGPSVSMLGLQNSRFLGFPDKLNPSISQTLKPLHTSQQVSQMFFLLSPSERADFPRVSWDREDSVGDTESLCRYCCSTPAFDYMWSGSGLQMGTKFPQSYFILYLLAYFIENAPSHIIYLDYDFPSPYSSLPHFPCRSTPFFVSHEKTNRHLRDNNEIVDKIKQKQHIGIEQNQYKQVEKSTRKTVDTEIHSFVQSRIP